MFGLSTKERFRRVFFEFLTTDVFWMPKSKLLKHYPGIRSACNHDAEGHLNAKQAAVAITRIVLTD